jgi:porcupine-like protein
MHYWLKIYVYTPMKQQYGHFLSILVTYLASALLHGFNFQLSIVLFSIGLFAYVEYGFRRKLATILDACVAARTCPLRSSCEKHTYTYWHPLTIIVNIFLCLLSLWHLTYLGQLFDGSSQETIGYSWQHVLDKWARLNFASHLVVIGTYVIFRSL